MFLIENKKMRFSDLDRYQQITYAKDFRIEFLESRGDAFQRLFEKLMGKCYPSDFMACRPWGNAGDWKNDGYLPSRRILFQVYAPNEICAAKAIEKINEDFAGAIEHWEEFFDEWVFVHNSHDSRLPPHVIMELAKLKKAHPQIRLGHWGWEELLLEFHKLDLASLEAWFGLAPTMADKVNLGYSDLQAVLDHIDITRRPTSSIDVKDVPRGKIEANLLSPAVASFLKIGMEKAALVQEFFASWRTPTYSMQIAATFKARYVELRDQTPSLHPDDIFGELESWAGGSINTAPRHRVAVLAVLAYLFEKCEIFEEPLP
jgi:hypothetical protein